MDFNIKLHSITRRWLINILPVIMLVVVVGEISVGVALFNYYKSLVISSASEYVRDINVLSLTDETGFPAAARSYAQDFMYRDKIEVQIFDASGNMLVTTNGFAFDGGQDGATDYAEAVRTGGEASWYGKNDNGERVLAVTTVLPDLGYGSNGAYRVVVSMEQVMTAYGFLLGMAIAIGMLMVGFALLSGAFFVNSIVRPVRDVTTAARKIAGGDMNARLEVKQNDEIGELCDTINYMASELENADKLKNDFISSVSH